jgi:Flp pilus assembly pilin Flp
VIRRLHAWHWQAGQGLVEYALILTLVAMIVVLALVATGGQTRNLYSDVVVNLKKAGL